MEAITLQVGKRYPDEGVLVKLGKTDGAVFNPFLSDTCPAIFLINLHNITESEKDAFNEGYIQFGMVRNGDGVICMFTVGGIKYECPLNMFYLEGTQCIPEQEEGLRLTVSMSVIESTTGNIEAMRGFTLHPESSSLLIEAAKYQLENGSRESVDANNRLISMNNNLWELAEIANMRTVGL